MPLERIEIEFAAAVGARAHLHLLTLGAVAIGVAFVTICAVVLRVLPRAHDGFVIVMTHAASTELR